MDDTQGDGRGGNQWGGVDASLLAQQLDGRLDLEESLCTFMRFRLAAIPSADEVLWDLGTFAFIASHLFSMVGRHLSSITDLLCLIERCVWLHWPPRP